MSKHDDGGPYHAIPNTPMDQGHHGASVWVEFAKAALTGFCANPNLLEVDNADRSVLSFTQADAMVAEMRKRERGG